MFDKVICKKSKKIKNFVKCSFIKCRL